MVAGVKVGVGKTIQLVILFLRVPIAATATQNFQAPVLP